jgi:ADP-L-glycero-D-manno-heptose 6-epimerase
MEKFKNQILVTGAAGMIGSGVVRYLNDLGYHNLILVDDLKQTDKWKNLVGKQFVDLISRHKIFEWLKNKESEIDAVIHLGACSDTMETNADYLWENNFQFSIRLAEWALQFNKKFLYASSAATYGSGSEGFSDDEQNLGKLHPINMYAFSKHLVDLWMKRENVLNKVVGLKYFNVFGPNEYHKGRMASMVFKMAYIARDEGAVRLYQSNEPERFADGEQKRDFIYVKDAVKITCDFLFQPIFGLYNLGQGKATSWNELALALFNALGKKPDIRYIEMPKELQGQYQNYTCADMTKTFAHFDSSQMTPILASVKDYVQNYLLKNARW